MNVLTDQRTDVMGAQFEIDPKVLQGLRTLVKMPPATTCTVVLTDREHTENDQMPGVTHAEPGVFEVQVAVGDAFEYSDKARCRINRTLLAGMRVVAAYQTMANFYGEDRVPGGAGMALVTLREAYDFARRISDTPELWALQPKAVELAEVED